MGGTHDSSRPICPYARGQGSRLVLRVPGLHQRWQTHIISNRGVLLENGQVRLNGVELTAEIEGGSAQAGTAVRQPTPPDRKEGLRFRGEGLE